MTTKVHLRFYEELNDFLPEADRKRRFEFAFEGESTIQDLLERLRVPASQVELVLADGDSVDFTHVLQQGEWISFYPVFESFDIRPLLRLRAEPLRKTRFVAGSGLRLLARYLRLCGFDTLDRSDRPLDEAARLSTLKGRILLVRQYQSLTKGSVSRAWYLKQSKPRLQLLEIIEALDLVASACPLTRCPLCNRSFRTVEETEQAHPSGVLPSGLPPRCEGCGSRFSEGPHLRRVYRFLKHVFGPRRVPS